MIRALGQCHDLFDTTDPGRLCRGRERWITPWELDGDKPEPVPRTVVSGAAFADDSARDALRGVVHGGITLSELMFSLYAGRTVVAFMEDGHPADIPEGAEQIEAYEGHRAGGANQVALVRWMKVMPIAELAEIIDGESPDERLRGVVILDGKVDRELLWYRLFLLVGMSAMDSPPSRFQPLAIPEILAVDGVEALVLLHRDKHGAVLGFYGVDGEKFGAKLEAAAKQHALLLVPFQIPPMLARWDRALAELRSNWDEASQGPFPVPEAEGGHPWERRRRRRRGRDEEGAVEEDEGADEMAEPDDDDDLLVVSEEQARRDEANPEEDGDDDDDEDGDDDDDDDEGDEDDDGDDGDEEEE